MQNDYLGISNVLSMEPEKLAIWLNENYSFQIPVVIETADDLRSAGRLMGNLTNTYSYIMSISTFAGLAVREAKRNKLDKSVIDDCIARRDLIKDFADTIKFQYNAVSRMITVKQNIDEELKMI